MKEVMSDGCFPGRDIGLIIFLGEPIEVDVPLRSEGCQRVRDTRQGCLRSLSFTRYLDPTHMRTWQYIEIAYVSLLASIGYDRPDPSWFVGMLGREDGARLSNSRGRIEHFRLPTLYPVLFTKGRKQGKHLLRSGGQVNGMRSCDLLGDKNRLQKIASVWLPMLKQWGLLWLHFLRRTGVLRPPIRRKSPMSWRILWRNRQERDHCAQLLLLPARVRTHRK